MATDYTNFEGQQQQQLGTFFKPETVSYGLHRYSLDEIAQLPFLDEMQKRRVIAQIERYARFSQLRNIFVLFSVVPLFSLFALMALDSRNKQEGLLHQCFLLNLWALTVVFDVMCITASYDLYKASKLRKEIETVPVPGVYKGFYTDETNNSVPITFILNFSAHCQQRSWTISGRCWDSTIGYSITGELQQSGKVKWRADNDLADGLFVLKQKSFSGSGLQLDLHRDQYSRKHHGLKTGSGPALYVSLW